MVNKDRIIPVTRTDLVSLFCTIYNMSNEAPIAIIPVENGTVTIPAGVPEGVVAIAAEPIKTLPNELPAAMGAFYFFPAYDLEDADLYIDHNGNKFVPNPGTLCAYDGEVIYEVDTQTEYGLG